jgi:hypothetical protein
MIEARREAAEFRDLIRRQYDEMATMAICEATSDLCDEFMRRAYFHRIDPTPESKADLDRIEAQIRELDAKGGKGFPFEAIRRGEY